MGYNNTNNLHKIKLVQNIVQQHYEAGISNYKGIFEKYVISKYPMSYKTFLKYINTPVQREILCNKPLATDTRTRNIRPLQKPVYLTYSNIEGNPLQQIPEPETLDHCKSLFI